MTRTWIKLDLLDGLGLVLVVRARQAFNIRQVLMGSGHLVSGRRTTQTLVPSQCLLGPSAISTMTTGVKQLCCRPARMILVGLSSAQVHRPQVWTTLLTLLVMDRVYMACIIEVACALHWMTLITLTWPMVWWW